MPSLLIEATPVRENAEQVEFNGFLSMGVDVFNWRRWLRIKIEPAESC